MTRTPRSWTDAIIRDPDAFDRRRGSRRHDDDAARARGPSATTAALVAAGFFGGIALGAAAWEGLLAGNRRGLFSASPVRRYAAVSYLGARPSVDTARLLRDYVRWEPHPVLRRRARRVLRELEATLNAGR